MVVTVNGDVGDGFRIGRGGGVHGGFWMVEAICCRSLSSAFGFSATVVVLDVGNNGMKALTSADTKNADRVAVLATCLGGQEGRQLGHRVNDNDTAKAKANAKTFCVH
ncbi:unnamed protein product [Ilex paraguariensis]|uniref:Uncharacterized protein n=1 Tax=Ilex paraguariensis TaxID=185542 RepID=A0ABC8TWW5_9AQUA